MDRLLRALHIGVLDLVSSAELQERLPAAQRNVQPIALVSAENAGLARFAADQVLEMRDFNKSFLRRLRPRLAVDRSDWLRFVLIKLDAHRSTGFFPRSSAATLLVDRHYSSLEPYRRLQPNLYAVSLAGGCVAALDFGVRQLPDAATARAAPADRSSAHRARAQLLPITLWGGCVTLGWKL